MNSIPLKNIISSSASVFSGITSKIVELFKINQQSDTLNELLFYGDGKEETKKQAGLNNLFCIYYMLVHASHTIDICMPSLDSYTISKCLISVHEKNNIKIRIVVHNNFDMKTLQTLSENGIEVKVRSTGVPLQHEFILIDSENHKDAVALMGSLDFELNRVNCNRDSTMLTSEMVVLMALKREFNRIWSCEDNVNLIEAHKDLTNVEQDK